ncbi:Predicted DNA binding protein, contains HTH domain [Halogranum rubrum]|uniref:Predicted DNA binding protein, contains HTH domain n=1 Tax=Halogranum rubrum TaxID=553466 RepID=A0A1I4BHW3_9EURY|nr:helix-turn-helix domain-containing protein [Halogranum rubrum]SFK68073.1 Predicted DNA binding protein, contains HTH domain [Halogranum rubrum]
MFQAEIHLQQEKSCVLSDIAARFDTSFEVAIEELHDHQVTFIIELEEACEKVYEFFEQSSQVTHIERLTETTFLVTKTSCGAYEAVDRNHGIMRRRNYISSSRREYTVLLFRREDLRAVIEEFKEIGTATLGHVKEFHPPTAALTPRQYEVLELALERGYFEWPRRLTSEELAQELDITHSTVLEHLRKAESKLLSDALSHGERVPAFPGYVDQTSASKP